MEELRLELWDLFELGMLDDEPEDGVVVRRDEARGTTELRLDGVLVIRMTEDDDDY